MKSHAQVVVIGGGVVGCSVLYHLTKFGWTDAMLIERSELTSGSTWHAAGGFHTLNGDPNVAKLQAYTIDLYKEIEEISGQSCGFHLTGGVMLAADRERLDFLKIMVAKERILGIDCEMITPEEARKLCPLIDDSHFIGAMYNPFEGHLDPSGTTHAYAKAARANGAEVVLRNRVTDTRQRPDGSWDVITEQGTVHAEHIVNAGGLWARECGRMVGLELPILAMEHHYLLTEDMPEVKEINEATGQEVLHIIDFAGELYLRQERGGMLMGTYEQGGVPWAVKETPWDFGHELLAPDLDRISGSLEVGFEHFPAFQHTGIKQLINGPFTFAPDGNPLIGPVKGLRNYWVACGVMAGFSQGGGVGLSLAQWMIDGDPGHDVWGMDVSRFGDYATMGYTNAKVRENYSRRFQITYPNEQLPAARPMKTTPIHGRLKDENAVFGAAFGLEAALWFAPRGETPVETPTYRRSNAFANVAEECKAVREAVGLIETSSFAKYEVTGAGAETWLSRVMANRMPATGRILLTPMLNDRGMLIGDFTVAKLSDERFHIFGSGVAQEYHLRWFERQLDDAGDVSLICVTDRLAGLSVAGPKSRELLSRLTDEDLSTGAFRFMSIKEMEIGLVPTICGRISFTGDLGYEIWMEPQYQATLFDKIREAGADLGLRLFGGTALNSLRLEKGFGSWAREYRPIYTPWEAGMDRFVNLEKNDFVGREAAARARDDGPSRKLVTMKVDADDADAVGDEPIWVDGEVKGWVTSGGYAHHAGMSVAQGYVPTAAFNGNGPTRIEIEILGDRRVAEILPEPLFDPKGERMRA